MRPDHAIKFPYQSFQRVACPIIPIKVNDIRIEVYVDSGAFISIFSSDEAGGLQIADYRTGIPSSVTVGDGNLIPVFIHWLPIKIGHISFKARIGFSPRLKIGFNLLGRKDIFDRFKVIFDERKQTISFMPYK